MLLTHSFQLFMKKQCKNLMNVSNSFSFTDGSTSSNTSVENYTATQASQEGKILIISSFLTLSIYLAS